MLEDRKQDLSGLSVPVPITPCIDGDFITFKKGDVAICKFNIEDTDSLYSSMIMLTGLLKTGACVGEIEQLRDLILEVVGS